MYLEAKYVPSAICFSTMHKKCLLVLEVEGVVISWLLGKTAPKQETTVRGSVLTYF